MFFSQKFRAIDSFRLVKTAYKNDRLYHSLRDISGLKIKGKTIIAICGNNTKDPIKAGNYGTHCLNWSYKYDKNRNVVAYSIFYPKEQPLVNGYDTNPFFDYEELTHVIFDPIISSGKKKNSVDEIASTLENVTFFGHSVGGLVMNELMLNLGQILKENGYKPTEIKKIYSSIVFIGYSPFRLVDAPIKNIYVAPIYDSVGSSKLVYDKMLREQKFVASSPRYYNSLIKTLKHKNYGGFVKAYKTNDEDVLYFADKKTFVATPNLLFDDGFKEDHNLAGVIIYPQQHPYKTQAGNATTDLLSNVFAYSLKTERNKFAIADIFKEAAKNAPEKNEEKE